MHKIFFVGLLRNRTNPKYSQEERDKERLEEIRELNRATLKATGEQMTEEEINDLRPSRYLDRREFKDAD